MIGYKRNICQRLSLGAKPSEKTDDQFKKNISQLKISSTQVAVAFTSYSTYYCKKERYTTSLPKCCLSVLQASNSTFAYIY